MNRRTMLQSVGAGAAVLGAGCTGVLETLTDVTPSVEWEYGVSDVNAIERDGELAIVASDRELAGLARETGEVDWRLRTVAANELARDEARYYAFGSRGIDAVDRTGERLWAVDGAYQSLHRGRDALVCYASNGQETHGFDPVTGTELWSWEGNMIYTYSPTFGLIPGDVYRGFDLNEGSVAWTYGDGSDPSRIAVTDERVVFSLRDADRSLAAVDVHSGSERWRSDIGEDRYCSGDVIAGVLYASFYGNEEPTALYSIDLESGRERWETSVDSERSATAAATVDDRLLVTIGPRNPFPDVYALDRATGSVEWTMTDHELVAVRDSLLVLEADGGEFVGVEPDGSVDWEQGMRMVPRVSSPVTDEFVYTPPLRVREGSSLIAAFAGTNAIEHVDVETGARRWRLLLEDRRVVRDLFLAGGDLYVTTDEGLLAIPGI